MELGVDREHQPDDADDVGEQGPGEHRALAVAVGQHAEPGRGHCGDEGGGRADRAGEPVGPGQLLDQQDRAEGTHRERDAPDQGGDEEHERAGHAQQLEVPGRSRRDVAHTGEIP